MAEIHIYHDSGMTDQVSENDLPSPNPVGDGDTFDGTVGQTIITQLWTGVQAAGTKKYKEVTVKPINSSSKIKLYLAPDLDPPGDTPGSWLGAGETLTIVTGASEIGPGDKVTFHLKVEVLSGTSTQNYTGWDLQCVGTEYVA